MYTVTITKSGQVTLPKELRDFLGVKPGQKITFNRTKSGVSIDRKISDQEFMDGIQKIHQKYHSSNQGIPDAVEAVRAFREGKISDINQAYKEKYLYD